jgi:hypothetical protein
VFAALYLSDGEDTQTFLESLEDAGHRIEPVVLESVSPSGEEIESAISEAEVGRPVVVAPLPSREILDIASRHPEREFLLLSGTLGGAPLSEADVSANVSFAHHQRRLAFRELGDRLAAAVSESDRRNRIVAYFFTGSEDREAELEAFQQGLGAADARTRYVTFEKQPTEVELREALFRVRAPTVRFVAAFVGRYNDLILDEVATDDPGAEGPLAVTEDLGPGPAHRMRVAYSIERDYAAAVRSFLEGARGRIETEARVVERQGAAAAPEAASRDPGGAN